MRRRVLSCCCLVALPTAKAQVVVPGVSSHHTVFSSECTSFFDWQATGLFYSHAQVLQPGYVTRLMACDHPHGYVGNDIGPTHVHPNYGSPKNNRVHDHYSPYNKPFALAHWLGNNPDPPKEEYILIVEPDTIFRKPVDCHRDLGVRPGVVASSPYSYLEGAENGMASQFVSPEGAGRVDRVGGFLCMHLDDLKKVVPLWVNLTVQVRKHPERYWRIDDVGTDYETGDQFVSRGHAPYISDMYGYIFAAAEVGLRHSIRDDVLLTVGHLPTYEPSLLRYDQWCKFGEKHFNKLSYKSGFNMQNCKQYFPRPPDLQLLDTEDLEELGRELICVEQVTVLNEAICEYHQRVCCTFEKVSFGCHDMRPFRRGNFMTAEGCERSCCDRGGLCSHWVFDESAADGPCFHTRKPLRLGECADGNYELTGKAVAGRKEIHPLTCPSPAWNDVQTMQEQQNVLGGSASCQDLEPACRDWQERGECTSNANYMNRVCPTTCRIEGCWDSHYNCRAWAEQGQCEANFDYMMRTCPVLCRERRVAVAKQRAVEDAERLKMLSEAREEEEDPEDSALTEEDPDPDDDADVPDVNHPKEKDAYRPARVVAALSRDPKPPPPAPKPPLPIGELPEDELQVAWGRVALAVIGAPLCIAGMVVTLRRLLGHGGRTRAVHAVMQKQV